MSEDRLSQTVDAIRRFNRLYTGHIGVLTDGLLDTPYTLTEARILYELGQQQDLTARCLIKELNLDEGYMSRILKSLERRRLVNRVQSRTDKRKRLLRLSSRGRKAFMTLNDRARVQVEEMLEDLPQEDEARLLQAMSTIEGVLTRRAGPVVIRTHQSGDIGWITHRHGVLYNKEYQFDETFEALVADILARLMMSFDRQRERVWIAEVDGERAGTVLIARASVSVAQLRLFLVEPWARGRGIGRRLIDECIKFARLAGYKKMTLWTQSILHAARHLYESRGFELVEEKPHRSFGHDLVGETWELTLRESEPRQNG